MPQKAARLSCARYRLPHRRAPLHAIYRVDMNKSITVTVPLTFINEPHNLLQSANACDASLA